MTSSSSTKILGVIHARGGSKRIPMKNLRMLGGKPLVCWIVEAARACPLLDEVIVSTDHAGIAEAARQSGGSVPFVRPAELAEDVPSETVTQHAALFYEEKNGQKLDVVVTLQPTTPFCLPSDIASCIQNLTGSTLDSVVTMREVRDRPEWMFAPEGFPQMRRVTGSALRGSEGVWQSLDALYVPNGAAYATRRSALFEKNSVFGDSVGGILMPLERSHDIDEPIDFVVAEALLSQKLVGNP